MFEKIKTFFNSNYDLIFPYIETIIITLLIVIIGKWLTNRITSIVRRSLDKSNLDQILSNFITNLLSIALMSFVIIFALDRLGIQTSSIIAVFAAAGLAIGLALQGSLSNFAAGIMIIFFKYFKIGDYVEIGSVGGSVKEISIFTTTLKTADNKTVIMPNSKIISNEMTNYSAEDKRRVDMIFGCSYSDDIKKVKKIIEKVISENELILKEPEPIIRVLELADSSVNFAVRPWVKTKDFWNVKFTITENIKLAFDEEGISIPFPQRDVHIFNEKS